MARRKSWRSETCPCGEPKETRWQLDITVCRKAECMDRVFELLGYAPNAELLARRAGRAGSAVEEVRQ